MQLSIYLGHKTVFALWHPDTDHIFTHKEHRSKTPHVFHMKPCNRRCRCICFVGNMWSFHYICHVTELQRGDKWCQLCFFWFYSALLFHETATGGNHLALLIANTLHSFGFRSPTTMEGSTFSSVFGREFSQNRCFSSFKSS